MDGERDNTKVRLCGKHLYDDDGEILFLLIPPSPPFVWNWSWCGWHAKNRWGFEHVPIVCNMYPLRCSACRWQMFVWKCCDGYVRLQLRVRILFALDEKCLAELLTRGTSHFLFFKWHPIRIINFLLDNIFHQLLPHMYLRAFVRKRENLLRIRNGWSFFGSANYTCTS